MDRPAFSECPGAWERHIVRKVRYPYFFNQAHTPSKEDLLIAQQRDQLELAQFNQHLAELAMQCSELADDSSARHIMTVKNDLDRCFDTACGLGADLSEQKDALSLLNDLITTAVRRAHQEDDEDSRLKLIKQESLRMRHLTRLNYPIVCDLLRADSLIPAAEIPAALLSETDEAFTVALEILEDGQKWSIAEKFAAIEQRLSAAYPDIQIGSKQRILNRQLAINQIPEEAETGQ
ncbi:hypothetical protein AB833_07335 [Chromatiales bacterium (ex Bugula neritina AB1)]|nr:hypothetical protein AB833_07335 [Chromatiales bacterium (ex Bugula neritina AB1)]